MIDKREVEGRIEATETAMEAVLSSFVNYFTENILAPYCERWGIDFRSGMGDFALFAANQTLVVRCEYHLSDRYINPRLHKMPGVGEHTRLLTDKYPIGIRTARKQWEQETEALYNLLSGEVYRIPIYEIIPDYTPNGGDK